MDAAQIAEVLGRLDERTELLVKEVVGNGQPGLKQKVADLEAYKNRSLGALTVLGSIGTVIWGVLEYVFHLKK